MWRLLLLSAILFNTTLFAQENYSRAKIWTSNQELSILSDLGIPVDHGTFKNNTFIISDFSDSEIELARGNGFEVDILIADVKSYYKSDAYQQQTNPKNENCDPNSGGSSYNPTVPDNFELGSMAGFYTYQEYLDEVDEMANLYPNLITPRAAVSDTLSHQGRAIYYMRISNDITSLSTTKPRVLYSSIIHAREPGSLSQTIFYMWYLLENYGTDPEVTFLVDNTELFFVPMVNPDGYIQNVTNDPNGGGMHRKNMNPSIGTTNPGVDLNRNFGNQWGTTGVSANENSDVFPGTSAFSEPETQNLKKIAENWNVSFAFNAHTHGNLMLHPVGYTDQALAADHDYFVAITDHMVVHNGYQAMKSSDLYPASGDTDDYMYEWEDIFAMTPEVSGEGFWAPPTVITDDCINMLFSNMVLAHLPHVFAVVDELNQANSITDMQGDFEHEILRLGRTSGDFTIGIIPISGISTVGANVVHSNMDILETRTGAISYELDNGINYGDEVKYVLTTDNGTWVKHDTITKKFGDATLQVYDDATTDDNWIGDWATTTEDFVSAPNSFTDSPNSDYASNSYEVYEFDETIDLTYATGGLVRFSTKWEIEESWDYAQFQISIDNGQNWIPQCGKYTNPGVTNQSNSQPVGEPLYDGFQTSWVLEEINLSDYLGEEIKMRFVLVSDQYINEDGFYFDEFQVLFNEDEDAGLSSDELKNLNLMPNPTNDIARVVLPHVVSEGSIQIIDAKGKIVKSQQILQQTNMVEVDVTSLEQGVYFVTYQGALTQTQPVRLVVVN